MLESLDYFVNSDTVSVVLIVVLVSFIAWSYLFPSYPDINEYFLKEQSSIATIRLPAETAVYRSKIAPHGRELISGLSVAGGEDSYKTRDGDVLDIWKLALKTKVPVARVISNDDDVLGNYTQIDVLSEELDRLVHSVGRAFASKVNDVDGNGTVLIALGTGFESLVGFFAGSLYGFSVVFIHNVENTDKDGLNEAVDLASPNIIISSKSILDNVEFKRLHSLSAVISVDGKSDNSDVDYISWSDLSKPGTESTASSTSPSVPSEPLKIIYATSSSFKIVPFTNKSIVAAIASQIKSLPTSQQWTKNDSVLTYNSQFNSYNFVLQLCSLVTGSKLLFHDNTIYNPLKLISDIRPTVIITEDSITESLAHISTELNSFNSIFFYRAKTKLSHGNLPKAVLSELNSLRIIHSGKYQGEPDVTTEDTNTVRALAGAYFVHALNTPLSLSPIAQTSVYDYRTSNSNKWIHFGPPLPCLEIKLRDFRNYKSATNRSGQLSLRGNSLSTPTEWAEETLILHLGDDGCVKQLVDVDYSLPAK